MSNQFIQLQSVGKLPAVPASELKAGDVRLFNFGSTSLVVKVIEKTDKTLTVISFDQDSNKYYMSDIRKTRLVAIVKRGQDVSAHTPKEAYNTSGRNKGMVDVSEYFQAEEQQPVENTAHSEKKYIGRKVFGQWGMGAGWEYGIIVEEDTDEYGTDVVIKWEDEGEARKDINELVVVDKFTNLDKIGLYLMPNEEEVIHEELPTQVETVDTVETTEISTENTIPVTYQLNDDKNGVELFFTEKPNADTRNIMKANGFRWGGRKQPSKWYAKQSENTISLAKQIAGVTDQEESQNDYNSQLSEKQPSNDWTPPEVEIEDAYDEKYNIPQDIQDREHESNWITRSKKTDHNKEIQETFLYHTNMVKELLPTLDNPYYEYKVKEALQRFKKKYHGLLVKWLDMKGKQPSWIVTGRAGLNVNKYNKTMERINNVMLELAELPNEFKDKLTYYENKSYKEKKEEFHKQLQEELKQPLPELKFKTVIKEFDLRGNGHVSERRFYVFGDYMITRSWGAWRVISEKSGKEIYSTKSNGTLKDAKAYVQLMIKKEREQSQAS
jgi:hypothetical protein